MAPTTSLGNHLAKNHGNHPGTDDPSMMGFSVLDASSGSLSYVSDDGSKKVDDVVAEGVKGTTDTDSSGSVEEKSIVADVTRSTTFDNDDDNKNVKDGDDGNDGGFVTEEKDSHIVQQTEQEDEEERLTALRRNFRLSLVSNFFFVLASSFYLWLAIDAYSWAMEAQHIPEHVLRADDDSVWDQFAREQAGVGGVRRTTVAAGKVVMRKEVEHDVNWWSMPSLYTTNDDDDSFIQKKTQTLPKQEQNLRRRQQVRYLAWRAVDWEDLPDDIREAVATLGFNEQIWNDGEQIPVEDLAWIQLTPSQQTAAFYLGYKGTSWPGGLVPTKEVVERGVPEHHERQEEDPTFQLSEPTDMDTIQVQEETSPDVSSKGEQNNNNSSLSDLSIIDHANHMDDDNNTLSAEGEGEEEKEEEEEEEGQKGNHNYNDTLVDNIIDNANMTESFPSSSFANWTTDGFDVSIGKENNNATIPDFIDLDDNNFTLFGEGEEEGQDDHFNDTAGLDSFLLDNHNNTSLGEVEGKGEGNENGTGTGTGGEDDHINGTMGFDTFIHFGNETEFYSNASWANWTNYTWSQLPEDLQAAAIVLGYNEFTWNNGIPSYTEELTWIQLTDEQRVAAAVFGYNQQTWDGVNDDLDDDDAFIPGMLESSDWTNTSWSELPDEIRAAAVVLGYDQFSWNNDEPTFTSSLAWHNLTSDEQNAAAVLGYNQETWDAVGPPSPPPVANWTNFEWFDLPEDIKMAAIILGYNQFSWDSGMPAFSDNLLWAELTTIQRDAATSLGYTQETWDNGDDEQQKQQQQQQGGGSVVGVWDDYWWSELPEHIRSAAVVLGYNEVIWNNSLEPFTEELSWLELTTQQREAAILFGYDQESWDGTTHDTNNTIVMPNWDDYAWVELPDIIQAAAMLLGYNEVSWDNNLEVFTSDFSWVDLTIEQQAAAEVLGYNQETWDGDSDGDHTDNTDDVSLSSTNATTSTKWDEYWWSDLPENIQNAARILGYNESLWNTGGCVVTDDLYWDELTNEQQNAAAIFGYTQDSWDGAEDKNECVEGSSSSSSSSSSTTATNPDDWGDYYWSELPEGIQMAATILGYDEEAWNGGLKVYTDDLYWDQLTTIQQRAAEILGYTKQTWDSADYGWDDDTVFIVGPNDAPVTKEMMIYFGGAFCFVIVGIIEWYKQKELLHIFLIIAGLCGVASSMLVVKNLNASNILNCISVHFFFFESFTIMRHSYSSDDIFIFKAILFLANGFFAIGALIDVVLSYIYLDLESEWNIRVANVGIFAAVLWLLCALMYTFILVTQRVTNDSDFHRSSTTTSSTNALKSEPYNKPSSLSKQEDTA